MTWIDRHRNTLRELFDVLGIADQWVDDDEGLVSYMEASWLHGEHGDQRGKPTFSADAEERARPLLARMDLTHRIDPAARRYDEIVVMGAAGIGLHRRLELVRSSEVAAGGLTILAGLRPHERAPRDGALGELIAEEGRFGSVPSWTLPLSVGHRAALLQEAGVDDHDAAALVFPHETSLAEFLMTKQWPDLRPVATLHTDPHPIENELGQREWTLRSFRGAGLVADCRVLNGAPVDRQDRPARPTSTSTFVEWLHLIAVEVRCESVLVVVNQPHVGRVGLALRQVLADEGASDLSLDFAGCEILSTGSILLQLGEIPARIRTDLRLRV